MREELLEFSKTQDLRRTQLLCEHDLKSTDAFSFSALRNELCVDGVYVRVFCNCAVVADVENPSNFGNELLIYLRNALSCDPTDNNNNNNTSNSNSNSSSSSSSSSRSIKEVFTQLPDTEKGHVDMVVEALCVLINAAPYVMSDIAVDLENLVRFH